MSTYINKSHSLVDKKKEQWAREREELAGLTAPWGSKDEGERNHARTLPKFSTSDSNTRKENTPRRQSLPPIYKKNPVSLEKHERELGGETSGYASDAPEHWNHLGYESSSSARDDRAKWKDRGANRFWESREIDDYTKLSDAPGWVKRGLQREGELIVANGSSPAESPEQDLHEERPYTSSSGSQARTYLRGQNIPLDPEELAERERRRQLAMAHQDAIRQQLDERERKRKEEKERRIREELEEEMRIEREQEIEKQRRENEERCVKEKLERERKRNEALQEALEIAEKDAKKEKLKQKLIKQKNINENVLEKEKIPIKCPNYNVVVEDCAESENSPRPKFKDAEKCTRLNNAELEKPIGQMVPADNLALVLQTPNDTFQQMQFAVFMPTLNSAPLPIAVPLGLTTGRTTPFERTENKVLTPTQYRHRRFCDSSTQTDLIKNDLDKDKYIREKLANLDVNRKDNRLKMRELSEDKPKWNANRPPTRYLKQSEKDPLYQKRKLRQKMRQVKVYDDTNNNYFSSDDSQTGSPRTYRKKGQSRPLWRKREHIFASNISIYQTELVPLESDRDQIVYKRKCEKCCCRCRSERHKYGERIEVLRIEHNSQEEEEVEDNHLPDCNQSATTDTSEVLEKLNSLHNGLMIKQEQWENSPRTPSLCSFTGN